MLFIALARSTCGFLFVMRTMRVFRGRALVPMTMIDSIGFVALISISLIEVLAVTAGPVQSVLTALAAVAPAVTFVTRERNQIALFRARVPLFIDHWILNLRLGFSVAHARAAALAEESAPLRRLLAPVFEPGGEAQRKHLILSPPVLRELEGISRSAHAALERLESLREHLRDLSEFRRKSGQAARQAVIQCVVLLFLFVALSVYTVHRFGWSRSGSFVTAAAALSGLSLLSMALLGRKRKWTL